MLAAEQPVSASELRFSDVSRSGFAMLLIRGTGTLFPQPGDFVAGSFSQSAAPPAPATGPPLSPSPARPKASVRGTLSCIGILTRCQAAKSWKVTPILQISQRS